MIKICQICNIEYKPSYKPQKFCSRVCMGKAITKPRLTKTCEFCKVDFQITQRDDNRPLAKYRFCSIKCRNKKDKVELACLACKNPFLTFPSVIKYQGGKYCSKICKDSFQKGANHFAWTGATEEHERLRKTKEYKAWRLSVFLRDNRTCVACGVYNKNIEADHIKPWSLFPELRFNINNGRTLCNECHRETYSYMNSHMKFGDFV